MSTHELRESVLVPASASPAVVVCVRSLGSNDVHTVVASEHESVPAFASRYCDESIVVPSPHEDLLAYKNALLSLAKRPDVRAVVPSREEDVFVLSKYRTEFEAHVSAAVPSMEGLRQAQDRLQLIEAAKEVGVPVPETWLLDEVPDWDRELIVKPRFSILTDEYVDGLSPSQCEGKLEPIYVPGESEPDRERLRAEMHENCRYDADHVPIVQKLVRGTGGRPEEYSFTALYDHGEAAATFQHYQPRGKTYAGGASACRESIYDPELNELGRSLLDQLGWHGLAEIEFLRDERTGEFVLMELNPRLWASLSCAVGAGVDFPGLYWSLTTGECPRVNHGYDVGFVSHSLFGELQYLLSLRERHPIVDRPSSPAAIWEVVSSCYEQPHFDFLHLDDPEPFVRGILDTVLKRA